LSRTPKAVGDPPAKKKGDADGKNDRADAARWEWKLLDTKGEATATGTFTGHANGDITRGKEQNPIGKFTTKGPLGKKVDVTFTKGPLEGKASLTMTERKPVTYKGELEKADGKKATLQLVIIND
jgi:hypothetical protein